MFEKNDKSLLSLRTITNVVCIILAVLGVIAGIVLCCLGALSIGLPLLFVVPFLSWLSWVIARAQINFYADVKFIRNRLYEQSNEPLAVFWKYTYVEENNSYGYAPTANYGGTQPPYPYAEQPVQPMGYPVEQGSQPTPMTGNAYAPDKIQQLLRLKSLLDSGAISQEEFEEEKKKYLS